MASAKHTPLWRKRLFIEQKKWNVGIEELYICSINKPIKYHQAINKQNIVYFQYDSIILNDGNNNDILYALLRSMPLHTYAHMIRILCLIWYCFLHARFVVVSVCKSAVFLNWYIRSFYCYHITRNRIYNVYGLYTPNIINLYFLYAVKKKNS